MSEPEDQPLASRPVLPIVENELCGENTGVPSTTETADEKMASHLANVLSDILRAEGHDRTLDGYYDIPDGEEDPFEQLAQRLIDKRYEGKRPKLDGNV